MGVKGTKQKPRSEEHCRKISEAAKLRYQLKPQPKGEDSPRWKPRTKCCDCGKEIKRTAKRCAKCQGKKHSTVLTEKLREHNIIFNCDWCGKQTKRCLAEYKKAKSHCCSKSCAREYIKHNYRGSNHGNFKNAEREMFNVVRLRFWSREWRIGVFQRDDYTCQSCGDRSSSGHSVNLQAHHIVTVKQIIKDYNIKSIEDADECMLLRDISNGITLCKECHKQEHKRLRKVA